MNCYDTTQILKESIPPGLQELFSFTYFEHSPPCISAQLLLNPAHRVYQGHFPDHPLLPGVCLLEMIKAILSLAFLKPMQLESCSQIKFVKTVIPDRVPYLDISLSYSLNCAGVQSVGVQSAQIRLQGSVTYQGQLYCKLTSTFVPVEEDLLVG